MVECSVCSTLNFLFGCLYSLVRCALEYPVVVLIISFLLALVLITNVQTARLLCDFTEKGTQICRPSTADCRTSCTFDYGGERGPHTWSTPNFNQSPINILDEYVKRFPIREILTWNHYDDLPATMTIQNTGHTVVVRATFTGNTPTISGADLLASYTFVELCFRWSYLNSSGSEHMINNRLFPLELQAMHRTGHSTECTSSYDLLMISYLYEISAENPIFDPIVQNLHYVQKAGTQCEINPFPLSYLFFPFRTGFYSYGGSLTEPPCYQGAEWFIYPEPLAISERQINEFRKLLNCDNVPIMRNSRPVQNVSCSRSVNFNQYNPMESCQMESNGMGVQVEEQEDDESME